MNYRLENRKPTMIEHWRDSADWITDWECSRYIIFRCRYCTIGIILYRLCPWLMRKFLKED